MEYIEVNEKTIRSCIGRTVCAVLHDGSQYTGTILGCEEGRLILGGELPQEEAVGTTRAKSKRKGKKAASKAKVSAFYPPYYPGAIALDLAWIWLLFAIPFLYV